MRVLVSAASRHGATTGIAATIAEHLTGAGHQVGLVPPAQLEDLGRIGAVVLGSAVYGGRWLPPAYDLVERLGHQLATVPVWLFSSGPPGKVDLPNPGIDLAPVLAVVTPREHRLFYGCLDKHKLTRSERARVEELALPLGDFRDFTAVTGYAGQIAAQLPEPRPTGRSPIV